MAKISNSRIQAYKSCRRMYQLRYIEGVIPESRSEALERGSSYHDKVEQLLKGEDFKRTNPKVDAMAEAFRIYILPHLTPLAEEEWFEYQTKAGPVIGRIDARNSDGAIIEHKTTSMEINEEYWYTRQTDEQLMTYMIGYHTNKAYYTVCRTPTIKQKKYETDEEFYERCLEWYRDDTDRKIAMREITHTSQELSEFLEEQTALIAEMNDCKLFYRNRNHCTKWGRMCEYAPICEHYDSSQVYIGFRKE